jgi:hypothetical protein
VVESLEPYSIAQWNTLLAVQASAAATLTGLVFVAVSINLNRIMVFPGLPGRAGESILEFLNVFFVSIVALVPQQPAKLLAIEILLIGLTSWIAQMVVQRRYLRVRTGHPWSWFIYRAVLTQLATLPFCVAAILLLLGISGGIYWLVPGFIFSFVGGIVGAWVLLVEVVR